MAQAQEKYLMEPQPDHGSDDALLSFLRSAEGQPVQIDASRVSLLAARQLQVLISAKKQWDADALSFQIDDASDAFCAGLTGFGLAENYFENEVKS